MKLIDIAIGENLPADFLAKILAKCVRADLVQSSRGSPRGYTLARPPETVTLREIVEAIDGPNFFGRCAFWNSRCNTSKPCVLHDQWKEIRPVAEAVLNQATLKHLVASRSEPRRRERRKEHV